MGSPRFESTIFKRLEPKIPKLHAASFVVLLLFHFSAAAMSSNLNFPQPYLTVNHNARVLHLNCTLPPEAYKQWDTVYGLHIMASIDGKNSEKNISVATLTKSKPDRGKLLDEVVGDVEGFLESGVSLKQGRPSPYLAVQLVLDSEQHGRYFCDIEHSLKSDITTTPVYSRKVYVGKDGVEPPGGGGGEVDQFAEVKTVDSVNVTWRHPQGLEFTEAKVEKFGINTGGNPAGTRKFLFFVSQDNPDILSKTSGVLLATMVRPKDDHHNFTMTVYVEPAISLPPGFQTYYTCFVPYVSCYGENEKLCVCSQDELQLASPIAAAATASSEIPVILGILLAISILVIISLIVAYRFRKYRSTCTVERSDKGDQNGALRNPNGGQFQDVNYKRVPYRDDIERGGGENPVGVNNDIEHGAARDNVEPPARAKKDPVTFVEIPNLKDEPLAKKDTPLVVEMPKDEHKNPDRRQRANRGNGERDEDRTARDDILNIDERYVEDDQNSMISDVPLNSGSGARPKEYPTKKRRSTKVGGDGIRLENGNQQTSRQTTPCPSQRAEGQNASQTSDASFNQTDESDLDDSILGAVGGEGKQPYSRGQKTSETKSSVNPARPPQAQTELKRAEQFEKQRAHTEPIENAAARGGVERGLNMNENAAAREGVESGRLHMEAPKTRRRIHSTPSSGVQDGEIVTSTNGFNDTNYQPRVGHDGQMLPPRESDNDIRSKSFEDRRSETDPSAREPPALNARNTTNLLDVDGLAKTLGNNTSV